MRHYPDVYDSVLTQLSAADRQLIEATLAGLRFVRNRMSLVGQLDVIDARPGEPGDDGVAAWTWRSMPPPELPASPQGRAWELSRYEAYQAQLAGRTIGATFERVAAFLTLATEKASPAGDDAAQAHRAGRAGGARIEVAG